MLPDSTLQQFHANNVELAYRLFGKPIDKKTPVLFVHGLSFFSYDWIAFGNQICSDRSGCAMDMRGFGDSSNSPGGDYTVPTMSSDIGAIMDHLGWQQVILVAHSMGGRNAPHFTAKNPERVKALVLVDWSPENAPEGSRRVAQTVANTPEIFADVESVMLYFGIDPKSPEGSKKLARFQAYTRPVAGGLVIKRDPFFSQQFRRQLETGEKAKHGVDLWQAVEDVRAPTLLIRGSRSDLFAAETLPKMLQKNSRIQAVEIDAGHYVTGDNPKKALEVIRKFIDEKDI